MQKLSFEARIENVLLGFVRYLAKTFCPTDLALFYPSVSPAPMWQVAGSAILIAGITIVAYRLRHARPYLFVGWFWFVGSLVPMIGIVQIGVQSIANRYTYWPAIGLTIAIVWEASAMLDRLKLSTRSRSRIALILPGVLIATLMAVTVVQIGYWHDTISVFSHDLDVTENNYVAHGFLGNELAKQGRDEEAAGHDLESLRIYPLSAEVRDQLARLLLNHGNTAGAIEQYRIASSIGPPRFETEEGLGHCTIRQRRSIGSRIAFSPGHPVAAVGCAIAFQSRCGVADDGSRAGSSAAI